MVRNFDIFMSILVSIIFFVIAAEPPYWATIGTVLSLVGGYVCFFVLYYEYNEYKKKG